MPLLRKPVLNPIQGLDFTKPSTMINDRAGFPQNMRLYRGELKKKEGYELYGDSPIFCSGGAANPLAITLISQYPLESLAIRLIRFCKERVEKYNSTTGAWDDVTGPVFTGDDDDFFTTAVAENKLLISNYADKMRIYNDAGQTVDLVSSDGSIVPQARYISYDKAGYLLAANYESGGTAYPKKVAWTDTGNIFKWGSGNFGSTVLKDDANPIKGMKSLNEYQAVYKKNSIYLARRVDTSDIWIFDLVETGTGLMSHRTLVDYNGRHFFMSLDDFRVFNGVRTESIADKAVQREIFGRVNWEKVERSHAVHMPKFDEIWFYIVVSGHNWPTEIWKYNYKMGF